MSDSLIVPMRPRVYEAQVDMPAVLRKLRELVLAGLLVDWDELLGRMLSIVVPQASRTTMLKHALNNTAPQDQKIKLFTNNVTPADTDTASSYTEMTTQGYAFIALTGSTWTFTTATTCHGDYAQQTYSFDGTGGSTSVYGYFVVETTSGLLLWSERFTDGPYSIVNNGDQIKITPKLNGTQG